MKSSARGFTLVELLVVISIIAILSVAGMVVFTGVQKNARDGRRRSDVEAMAKAYEAKYSGTYAVPQDSDFASGKVPVPPEGGSYFNVIDDGGIGFKVCAALEANPTRICSNTTADCYCQASSQGTIPAGTTPDNLIGTNTDIGLGPLTDTFNRSDATTMGSSDSGQSWVSGQGTWGITNGSAYSVTGQSGDIILADVGRMSVYQSKMMTTQAQMYGLRLLVRAIDKDNWLGIYLAGGLTLYKKENGSQTQLVPSTGYPPSFNTAGTWQLIKVTITGNILKVYAGDTEKISYALTNSEMDKFNGPTATKVGFQQTHTGASVVFWDDLQVQ